MHWKFLLTIFALVYIPAVYCQEPVIVDAILPEVKKIGETGLLNCTVARKGTNIVTWTHVTNQQPLSRDETITLSINKDIDGQPKFEIKKRSAADGDRITYMLIIRGLREDDAGDYSCTIEIQGKKSQEWPSRIGKLTVQVPPKVLTSLTTTRIESKIGESQVLRCDATGIPRPNITWVRADGDALPNMKFTHRGSVLKLDNIRRTDQGVYRCVADNTVRPPDQYDVQLLVFSRPLVRSVQNTVGQAANGKYSAKLECKISAYPDAVLKWYKKTSQGKMLINDDDKYDIQKLQSSDLNLGETWYYLKVKNIQANDFGDYYCEGSNSQGTEFTKIILFETFECQGPNCPSTFNSQGSRLNAILVIIFFFSYCFTFL